MLREMLIKCVFSFNLQFFREYRRKTWHLPTVTFILSSLWRYSTAGALTKPDPRTMTFFRSSASLAALCLPLLECKPLAEKKFFHSCLQSTHLFWFLSSWMYSKLGVRSPLLAIIAWKYYGYEMGGSSEPCRLILDRPASSKLCFFFEVFIQYVPRGRRGRRSGPPEVW